MEAIPANEYIEVHNGTYYVAATRIGLDVIVYDFRNGSSAEAIFDAYPYNRFAGKSLRNHPVHSGTCEGNRGLRRREQAIDFRGPQGRYPTERPIRMFSCWRRKPGVYWFQRTSARCAEDLRNRVWCLP
jgi:hypothetical protein